MAAPIGPILMIVRRVLRLVSREQRRRTRAAGRSQQQGTAGSPQQGTGGGQPTHHAGPQDGPPQGG